MSVLVLLHHSRGPEGLGSQGLVCCSPGFIPGIQLHGCSPCGQDSTVLMVGVSMFSAPGSASWPTAGFCVIGRC